MTCNKNCEECIYAQRIKSFRCGNKNITCARNCDSCVYGILKNIRYTCAMHEFTHNNYFERRKKNV